MPQTTNKIIRQWFELNYPHEYHIFDSIRDTSLTMNILCEMAAMWYYYTCVILADEGDEINAIAKMQAMLFDMIEDKVLLVNIKEDEIQ